MSGSVLGNNDEKMEKVAKKDKKNLNEDVSVEEPPKEQNMQKVRFEHHQEIILLVYSFF